MTKENNSLTVNNSIEYPEARSQKKHYPENNRNTGGASFLPDAKGLI